MALLLRNCALLSSNGRRCRGGVLAAESVVKPMIDRVFAGKSGRFAVAGPRLVGVSLRGSNAELRESNALGSLLICVSHERPISVRETAQKLGS